MVPGFDGKTIVITGGTGSFGRTLTDVLLRETRASRVIVFSRDELKQSELEATYRGDDRLRLLLGDVRDRERLHRVLDGVDIYTPAHLHPLFEDLGYRAGSCPRAEELAARAVSIPIFPRMTDDDTDRVIDAVTRSAREVL